MAFREHRGVAGGWIGRAAGAMAAAHAGTTEAGAVAAALLTAETIDQWHAAQRSIADEVAQLNRLLAALRPDAAGAHGDFLETAEPLAARLDVLPFTPEAAVHYGQLCAELEKAGCPAGPYDMLIGAA